MNTHTHTQTNIMKTLGRVKKKNFTISDHHHHHQVIESLFLTNHQKNTVIYRQQW